MLTRSVLVQCLFARLPLGGGNDRVDIVAPRSVEEVEGGSCD